MKRQERDRPVDASTKKNYKLQETIFFLFFSRETFFSQNEQDRLEKRGSIGKEETFIVNIECQCDVCTQKKFIKLAIIDIRESEETIFFMCIEQQARRSYNIMNLARQGRNDHFLSLNFIYTLHLYVRIE